MSEDRRPWSLADMTMMREFAGKESVAEIARALGRSVGSVYQQASKFHITLETRGKDKPAVDQPDKDASKKSRLEKDVETARYFAWFFSRVTTILESLPGTAAHNYGSQQDSVNPHPSHDNGGGRRHYAGGTNRKGISANNFLMQILRMNHPKRVLRSTIKGAFTSHEPPFAKRTAMATIGKMARTGAVNRDDTHVWLP